MNDRGNCPHKPRKPAFPIQTETHMDPSKSNLSQSEQSNKAMDMIRLITKAEQSRITQINYIQYESNPKKPQNKRFSDNAHRLSINSFADDQNYSTYANRGQPNLKIKQPEQSFLSNYQNNSIIGVILYLLFAVFITLEVIAASYFLPKVSSGYLFWEEGLITLLISEVCYYLLLRYLSGMTKKRIFMSSTVVNSFKKLMHKSKVSQMHTQPSFTLDWIFLRPYALLAVVGISVIFCQLSYSRLVSSSMYLFEAEQTYLVSTIFWANVVLPFLFSNFYLNRPVEEQNCKLKIFPFIILGYVMLSLFEGVLILVLIAFKMLHTYIQSKQEFDVFHVDQIFKAGLLVFVLIYTAAKYLWTSGTLFDQEIIYFLVGMCFHVAMLTASMFITRVIALKYLKEELYKYFYTEMHICLAFIGSALLLNWTYLGVCEGQVLMFILLNTIFLGTIGGIVFLEGKEKMLVTMQVSKIEQQLIIRERS